MHKWLIIIGSIVVLQLISCQNECTRYKKRACVDLNSEECHQAMQDMENSVESDCKEKIAVLDSIRKMEKRGREIREDFFEAGE